MRIALFGKEEQRLLSLMDDLSGTYSRCEPWQAIAYLLDKYAAKIEPLEGDLRPDVILSLWSSRVEPFTPYSTPKMSATLRQHIVECLHDMPTENEWRNVFDHMVDLRGLIESGNFSLPKVVRPRKDDERLIIKIANGEYDRWIAPKASDTFLEDILRPGGDIPGDWTVLPPLKDDTTLRHNRAPEAYVRALCSRSPHVARWIVDRKLHDRSMIGRMKGLLGPLVENPDVEHWGSIGR